MRMMEGLWKEESIGLGWLEAAARGECGEECWQEYPCEGQGNGFSEVR